MTGPESIKLCDFFKHLAQKKGSISRSRKKNSISSILQEMKQQFTEMISWLIYPPPWKETFSHLVKGQF